jgi:L-iditol 2-dehydrogenase
VPDHLLFPLADGLSDGAPAVMDATGGRGVDVVIEVAGTDVAIQIAVAAVRPGGRIALGGIRRRTRRRFRRPWPAARG